MLNWLAIQKNSNKDTDEKKKLPTLNGDNKWLLYFAAGIVSGPVSRTITAPLDRFRLLIQVDPQKLTFRQAIRKSLKDSGIRGLWRGNLINILKVGPEISLRLGIYEKIKSLISKENEILLIREKLICGGTAGATSHIIVYPLDTLKTRMTIRMTGQYNGIFDAIRKIYVAEGILTFYRGYRAAILGIIPYTSVDLVTHEKLKEIYVYQNPSNSGWINMGKVGCCAIVSSTFAQLCSYPLFLIKSRQQAKSKIIVGRNTGNVYRALKALVRGDGLRGLFRGLIPTLGKSVPASAINYVVFELAQNYFKQYTSIID